MTQSEEKIDQPGLNSNLVHRKEGEANQVFHHGMASRKASLNPGEKIGNQDPFHLRKINLKGSGITRGKVFQVELKNLNGNRIKKGADQIIPQNLKNRKEKKEDRPDLEIIRLKKGKDFRIEKVHPCHVKVVWENKHPHRPGHPDIKKRLDRPVSHQNTTGGK